ncbi:beta-lactamase family protein [Aliifodinibius salicampi]|uniref:Beta-lactamase n=1 Tax=Fodinibius salicampi TaxID=1920655 RepID=A0ABT3Q0A2_9BACT|nr:serine hydrolase domain-containing protein [Fodinibius salicampi]MCW9713554.1 beta-lactamase family protein [Fodinibius salicampi]
MKRLYYFLFIIATTAACGSVSNPEVAVNQLQSQSGISEVQTDRIFHTLRFYPNQTQLSIAFIDDTSAVFYGAVRAADTLRITDNKDLVFEIGSLSKVFTAALLADLAYQNKLALDQPIKEQLDFPLNVNDSLRITFKHLANHTSGLPRLPSGFIWESMWHMDNPYKDYDEEKLRDYMRNEMELDHVPGTHFQYSNIGAGILGYVLTHVEDQSYEKMLQQRIFQPLDMPQTTTQRTLVAEKLVPGLTKRGNIATNWDLGAIPGAGALLSTAVDMARFGSANFDTSNKVLNLQQQKTFGIDEKMDIALGWFILKQDSTTRWHWHNGGTGGYRSSMALDLDRKKGVVVLSNISAGHSHAAHIDSLSFTLLRSMEPVQQPLN